MAIQKIIRENLSDTVFQALRQEIINRNFKAGDKLPSMGQLSRQFGVSVATIKIVLQRLSALGLIETKTGQGSFVLIFSPDQYLNQMSDFLQNENDITDVAEYRLYMETTIAELAMKKAKRENFNNMENLLHQMDEAIRNNDIPLHGKLDYQFHLEIARATQNNIFVLASELTEKVLFKHTVTLNEQFFKKAAKRRQGIDVHWRLYNAIKAKDIVECRKCYVEMLNVLEPGQVGD
jgi:GntR family transcriptional repressor for pyruvate dehydrogenase complex